MKNRNPYATLFASPAVADPGFTDGVTRVPGQSAPFTDGAGNINANDTKDLAQQIARYMQANADGAYRNRVDAVSRQEGIAARREALHAAFNDNSGETMRMLGSAMAVEIWETTNREGFARRMLQFDELGQGELSMVTLKTKNVIAYLSTSPTETIAQEIRDKRVILPEFSIKTRILAANQELQQTTTDLLEEKYEEGLEAIMVQEDRMWHRMAVKASQVRNITQHFTSLTPAVLARLIEQITQWGLPAQYLMFSTNMWNDLIASTDFHDVYDPVTQRELLTEGNLGSMYGVQIYTDTFRQPNMKVIDTNEILVVGAPINHGAMRMRGQLTVEPINLYPQGIDKKGWFFSQIMSMIIGNSLSVARGVRI